MADPELKHKRGTTDSILVAVVSMLAKLAGHGTTSLRLQSSFASASSAAHHDTPSSRVAKASLPATKRPHN